MMVPCVTLLLPLVVAVRNLPRAASVRPADSDTLEVNAKGSLLHLKNQHLNETARGEERLRYGSGLGGQAPDGQQTPEKDSKDGTIRHVKGGVSANRAGDLHAWISTMTSSVVSSLIFFALFKVASVMWGDFPLLFANNTLNGKIPPALTPDFTTICGWATATYEISRDVSEAAVGLDNAFLIEFYKMAIQMVAYLTALYCMVFMVLHYFFGHEQQPPLSQVGMEHLEDGSLVFWAHCAGVWFTSILVVETLMAWNDSFLERRTLWLQAMPAIRATTILVEEVPSRLRSDEGLRDYFSTLFGEDAILSAFMVRHTQHLVALKEDWHNLSEKKLEAESKWELAGGKPEDRPTCLSTDGITGCGFKKTGVLREKVDAIKHFTSLIDECAQEIAKERLRIQEEAASESNEMMTTTMSWVQTLGNTSKSVCTHAGFVTFKTRRDAAVARMVNCKQNTQEMITGDPPDPSDIRYEDFMIIEGSRNWWQAIGYLLIACLFFGFLPVVIFLQSLSNIQVWEDQIPAFGVICNEYPVVESLIEGVLSSLGINLVISFVPTVLLMIFNLCFTLRANAWAQATLQVWYFWFQVVFVILVTAIGGSLFETTWTLLHEPFELPKLLAATLPTSTHFYLNFLSLRWGTHVLELTRIVQVSKFLALRVIYKDTEQARQLSEPEDQEYYGIGSRSARSAIAVIIPIIYGPFCPLIYLMSLIELVICRTVKGYLINFAESRKPDLGGVFWVQMVKHVLCGLFIYLTVMFGVLHTRGPVLAIGWLVPGKMLECITPGTMIFPVGVYLLVRYRDFLSLKWDVLPFEEAIKEEEDLWFPVRKPLRDTYEQAELIEVTCDGGLSGAASSSATFSASPVETAQGPEES